MTKAYQRTKGEFVDAFNYGKVFFIRKVESNDIAHISRVYYLKDKKVLRVMKNIDRKKLIGLDETLRARVVPGNYLFIDDDGYTSIMEPEVNICNVFKG